VTDRIVICGGPLVGKTTLADSTGLPAYCGDPRSIARNPQPDVTYVPEGLTWSGASTYVVDNWLGEPGPWVAEGIVMVRALRKWIATTDAKPCDEVWWIVPRPGAVLTPAQRALQRGVETIWAGIRNHLGVPILVRPA
jgi:hypothetical protein